MVEYLVEHSRDGLRDPTTWRTTEAVKYVRSVWAESAASSDNPVTALRAAVIQLMDVEAFKIVHDHKHPAGCIQARGMPKVSLLKLAIEEGKDELAVFLVNNCKHARASIGYDVLVATGFSSRPLNVELFDLLVDKAPNRQRIQGNCTQVFHFAACVGNLPCVKALVRRGVPCSENELSSVLWLRNLEMPAYMIETNPELLTTEAVRRLAFRGHHAYLRKLHASHPHVFQSDLVGDVLAYKEEEPPVWEMLQFLYELFGSSPVDARFINLLWVGHSDDVLLFMSLVWPHEDLARRLSVGDRGRRVRFYSRLRGLVPSLFADFPPSLPWCCQLHILLKRVESREITQVDVERARAMAKAPQDIVSSAE